MEHSTVIWTKIDEAPALASVALLPIVQSFLKGSDIEISPCDISLAGRIIANFPDNLTPEQKLPDYLEKLGKIVNTPEANIIKLPNISASIPQLQAAVSELQQKGYDIPDYPEEAKTEEEKLLQKRFAKVLGSAVNPVLREGNSDRRAAASVKDFARKNPHKMMKPWPESGSVARVAHMEEKDFFGSEISTTLETACNAGIEFQGQDGKTLLLKEKLPLVEGEVIDAAVMNVGALRQFYRDQIEKAKEERAILSLHLKATMMKVSDPIMFGHCVDVYFQKIFKKHAHSLKAAGAGVNNGLADILDKIKKLPEDLQTEIRKEIQDVLAKGPGLAMVDSDKGITNLHVPNNIIVDASMPNVIRDGGKMWNRDGKLQDTVAMIPDRSYATMYKEVIEDCRAHGQFDPATMGSVSNVGLMAKKAEEYGSHDKTFEAPGNGIIQVKDDQGNVLLSQAVETGDIFRMCQAKDVAIRDWVKLGVARARATGNPAVFWLDPARGHDAEILKKVECYLKEHDIKALDIRIMAPDKAMEFTLGRVRQGKDTISVTGNVLRDYLTDLFPILELGTSARMLSIVPLLEGGGLFETGAGGSAPKHVEQFLKEGHLRWDSLGEYCAIVPSLEQVAAATGNPKAKILAAALDEAIGEYLEQGKTPSRKVNEIDNRGASFYLALYWARALARQSEDKMIQERFAKMATALAADESRINTELMAAQGSPMDIGGYYLPDAEKTTNLMRPSTTLNNIIASL